MQGFVEWWVFVGVMALGQFSPGPDMVLLTRVALADGVKAGCWTAVGIACGLSVHAAVAVTGVAVMIGKGGWLLVVMKWLAVGYLLWLAYQLVRSGLRKSTLQVGTVAVMDDSVLASWRRGLLCNLLNPKVALFLAGVTAPFLAADDGVRWLPLLLWATIVLEGLILWCAWVWVLQARAVRERYLRVAHWFDLAFGLELAGLAGVLIFL